MGHSEPLTSIKVIWACLCLTSWVPEIKMITLVLFSGGWLRQFHLSPSSSGVSHLTTQFPRKEVSVEEKDFQLYICWFGCLTCFHKMWATFIRSPTLLYPRAQCHTHYNFPGIIIAQYCTTSFFLIQNTLLWTVNFMTTRLTWSKHFVKEE